MWFASIFGVFSKVSIGTWIKYGAFAAAILVIYLYWNDRTNTIDTLRTEVSVLTTEAATNKFQYEYNIKALTDEIDAQNKSIALANLLYQETVARANARVAAAELRHNNIQHSLEQQLHALRNQPTPVDYKESIEFIVDIAINNPWPTEKK